MGKIKVPNNGERIIVVDGVHREGCFLQTLNVGCALIFAIIGLLILGICWTMHKVAESRSEMPPQTPQERTETQTRQNARPDVSESSEPLPDVVSLMFHKSCRNYMNDPDSYKPGNTRIGNHPEGYAYIHEFRGRNAFGGMIKDICGLLYSTNTHSWTFFDKDQLPELLKDVTVNGKHITDESGQSAAPRADPPKATAAPEPTVKIATCEKCKGKGVVPVQANCSKCGGAGRIYVNGKWTPCPKKVTTGKRKCDECDGSGTIEVCE